MYSVNRVSPPPTNVTHDFDYPTARSGCKEKWLLMFDLGELHTRPPLTLCCVLLTDHRNVDEVGGGSTLLLPGRGRNLQRRLTGLIDPCSNLLGGRLLTLAHADEQK